RHLAGALPCRNRPWRGGEVTWCDFVGGQRSSILDPSRRSPSLRSGHLLRMRGARVETPCPRSGHVLRMRKSSSAHTPHPEEPCRACRGLASRRTRGVIIATYDERALSACRAIAA